MKSMNLLLGFLSGTILGHDESKHIAYVLMFSYSYFCKYHRLDKFIIFASRNTHLSVMRFIRNYLFAITDVYLWMQNDEIVWSVIFAEISMGKHKGLCYVF